MATYQVRLTIAAVLREFKVSIAPDYPGVNGPFRGQWFSGHAMTNAASCSFHVGLRLMTRLEILPCKITK